MGSYPPNRLQPGHKKKKKCCDIYEKSLLAYLNPVNLCMKVRSEDVCVGPLSEASCLFCSSICLLLFFFSRTYVSAIGSPRPSFGSRFVIPPLLLSSLNPVHYVVRTGLPDASSEVRGWPVWRRHG